MAITFIVGIWLLKIFLGFGEAVYAVIVLTGSSIGIAEILKETIRGATIPELGKSYHSKNDRYFQEIYSSTLLLALISACFSTLVLSLFVVFLDYFTIPENLVGATKYYIATRMACVFLSIVVAPVHNIMPISGRMMSYNFWLTLDRLSDLISALAASYLLISGGGAEQLIMFSTISLILKIIVLLSATAWSVQFNRKFIPDHRLVSSAHLKKIGKLIGWNAAAVISVNLYLRFDIIAVNILYGIKATVIFGLASQLAAYVNMSSLGFVTGLDSVVTQLSKLGNKEEKNDVYTLSKHIVELQALILGFLIVILALHTEFIINILFSDRLSADIDTSMIVICFFMLMSGMIFRGMSEGWMSILTGMGNIKAYAVPVLIGALLNPALVLLIGHFFKLEPGLYFICFVFLALILFFHMYYIPKVTANTLEVNTTALLKPLVIPMGLTAVTITIAYLTGTLVDSELLRLMLTIVVACLSIGIYFLVRCYAFLRQKKH